VTVTVANSNGLSGSLASAFTYIAPPTVSSVAPSSGSTAGGTAVTITGTNFAAGATVTLGGAAATNVVVVSSTSITTTTPAHAAGPVTVTVTNPGGGSGNLASAFTYIAPPTVSTVAPNNGLAAGGTVVTITGTHFAAGATVTFGGTTATNVVVVSSTSITATTPAHAAGAVTVTVTVSGQSGNLTNGFTYNPAVAISFGQVAAATPQSATATVPVTYPAAQTAGDLNIVVVGWNDTTATVQSVKDSAGNNYSLAIGPTSGTGLRQSIYYAANIVGGSNTVTVTFSQAASYPDVRILEYKGVTTLDVTAGASGSSASANSGPATTTVASELIFGADTVATFTKAAGSGFTSRIITSPNGDIAEDKVATTAGSNSAAATLSASGPWVMQMVTFKWDESFRGD
jgi:IPT/TIG domain